MKIFYLAHDSGVGIEEVEVHPDSVTDFYNYVKTEFRMRGTEIFETKEEAFEWIKSNHRTKKSCFHYWMVCDHKIISSISVRGSETPIYTKEKLIEINKAGRLKFLDESIKRMEQEKEELENL